jgi:hypothetical protein
MEATIAICPFQLHACTDDWLELQMHYVCMVMRMEHDELGYLSLSQWAA